MPGKPTVLVLLNRLRSPRRQFRILARWVRIVGVLCDMVSKVWQLQEAKNHFSEVVDLAIKQGPQTVTKRGKPAVVILSSKEYERTRAPKKSLFQALRECPAGLAEIIPPRSNETARTTA